MDDLERQADELLALSSIYEDLVKIESDNSGWFEAHVQIPAGGFELEGRTVEHLPPITLRFELPSDYPSSKEPLFTVTCEWLTPEQLEELCKELYTLWLPGNEVLYLACDFLCSDGVLQFCDGGIKTTSVTLQRLLSYDHQKRHQSFAQTLHLCPVCFMDRLGSNCEQIFPCQHITCKDCLSNYLMVQIAEGAVAGLHCPHEDCKSTVHPNQIQALVSPECFNRYERLTLQRSLDSMSDVTQCPRKRCGLPVLLETDVNMGRCPHCSLVFCSLCRLTYHGVERCKVSSGDIKELLNAYRNGELDSEVAAKMEKKFGKNTIEKILQEAESLDWVQSNSMPCPHCKSPIQKFGGCNKVVCTKCSSPMCWLCGIRLDPIRPYAHFNDPNSKCNNRLFQGELPEDDF